MKKVHFSYPTTYRTYNDETPLVETALFENSKDLLAVIRRYEFHPKYKSAFNRVNHLLSTGSQINSKNERGETPLMLAVKAKDSSSVGLLIEKGAPLYEQDNEGWTVLHYAAQTGNLQIIKLVMDAEAGILVYALNHGFETPLHIAAQTQDCSPVVKLLIDAGADKEAKSHFYNLTPLLFAVSRGHLEVVRLLIDEGANKEAQHSSFGYTALLMAALMIAAAPVGNIHATEEAKCDIVKLLINSNANMEAKNKKGETALMIAAAKGEYNIAELLIDSGADIEARNKKGFTPLLHAVANAKPKIVKLLIDAEAEINAQNYKGYTALMIASGKGEYDIVTLLIDSGANINVTNQNGETALMVAEQPKRKSNEQQQKVISLLKETIENQKKTKVPYIEKSLEESTSTLFKNNENNESTTNNLPSFTFEQNKI